MIIGQKAMAQDESLALSGWLKWSDSKNMLYHHLSSQALEHLKKRSSKVSALKTEAQWVKRQNEVRRILMELVGPFPEKTPLNPRVTGIVKKEGYRIEKVIYESRPNFYVTACLFIPDGLRGKTPAILNPIGHSQNAFREELYQNVIFNLVRKGFIVLSYDPIGQGERVQYFDPEKGSSRIGGTTSEHSYVGSQCFVSGSSFARYRIWDGIRSIDYLLTRDEVDPERIGANGISGGGTLTSYVSAFDDRIYAAAPECYITGFRRLLESIGPQDAEQNFYHGIASGIDHADLLEVRVPKPALIMSTTRDFFSIQGARETYAEIKGAYEAFGMEENLEMTEDDAPHDSTRKNREAMYAFFQKHLKLPGNPEDEEVELLDPDELRVTQTGQVSTSLGGETAFSINRSETGKLLERLENSRKDLANHLTAAKDSAMELTGYIHPEYSTEAMFIGRYQRDGYSVEKYVLNGEGKCVIPVLLMVPNDTKRHPAVIYIHPEGKQNVEAEWLVKKGFAVLAPDLTGIGETGYNDGMSYYIWFASILIARSIAGIQAADIVRCVRYLESRDDIDYGNISAIACGGMCVPLLYAAAFESSIRRIALIEPPISYSSIVMSQYYDLKLIPTMVAGALTAYDLPDVAACLAPRKLLMVNVTDKDLAEGKIIRSAYDTMGGELEIKSWETGQSPEDIFSNWLK